MTCIIRNQDIRIRNHDSWSVKYRVNELKIISNPGERFHRIFLEGYEDAVDESVDLLEVLKGYLA